VLVHEANIQDYDGGKLLLAPLKDCFPRLKLIWADSGYDKMGFPKWVKATLGWEVEIVKHPWSGLQGVWAPKDAVIDWEQIRPSGFHVLPHRWVVERTFGWLSTWRRLSKDYEVLPSSEEAWISIAMMRIMLKRLASTPLRDRSRLIGKCRTKWFWHTLGDACFPFVQRDRSTEDRKL
jgi:transposase